MSKWSQWKWQVVALAVSVLVFLILDAVCPGQEVALDRPYAVSVLTDGQTIDSRFEWTWRGGLVTTGPVLSWNKEQPDHLWGGGVFGMLLVTPNGTLPLANLFPWVGEQLGLPETIPVDIRLGGQIQVVNVAHGPNVAGAPLAEIGLGPVLFNFRVQVAEGGGIEDLMQSRPAFFFGLRPLRF
jgi:hypothetical protein